MSATQITFRSVQHSPSVESHIKKHIQKIFAIYNRVTHCKVVIDAEHRNKHKGKLFSVSIFVTVPGHKLYCKKQNQNLYVAILEGFMILDKLIKKHCKTKLISNDTILQHLAENNSYSIEESDSLETA